MEIVLKITGLHCANCARELEEELNGFVGISSALVDFVTQTVRLEYVEEAALKKAVKHINQFEQVKVLKDGEEKAETHGREIFCVCLAFAVFAVALLLSVVLKNTLGKILSYALLLGAYLTVGMPVLISTAKNIAKGKVFDENFLMTVASVGALLLGAFGGEGTHGAVEGVAVMLLYQLGELLQGIAVGSSRKSVQELMKLKSDTATVLKNGEQTQVKAEEVKIGDVLLVKAGEKIPVDGVLNDVTATLDTKFLTGEAEPKTFKKGEELLAGYVNGSGVLKMTATREYENSAVKKVLDLVENSTAKKAAPEKFITKFAKIYTPVVCLCAIVVAFAVPAIATLFVGGGYGTHFPRWALSALNFLVISCPCALIISVPLTYFSGIGVCAKRGILVKGATYLDELTKIKTVAFDKTGTLTNGDFTVRAAYPNGISEEELLTLAASIEKASSHPLAKAFEKTEVALAEDVEEIAGEGLIGKKNEKTLLVGSEALLQENGIEVPFAESAYTLVYVAYDGRYAGRIEIGDTLRSDAKEAIESLKEQGIDRFVILTGDRKERAEAVAKEAGISRVEAKLFPEDKLKKAEELKRDGLLLYVGDGVNDAPVMACADVAVSMGKLGSAAAVEASDLVLVSDRLSALAKGISTAKKTRRIVTQNIVFSIAMKVAFMALGLFGVLPLWLAVFADVGVMLLAVLNSLRMKSKGVV